MLLLSSPRWTAKRRGRPCQPTAPPQRRCLEQPTWPSCPPTDCCTVVAQCAPSWRKPCSQAEVSMSLDRPQHKFGSSLKVYTTFYVLFLREDTHLDFTLKLLNFSEVNCLFTCILSELEKVLCRGYDPLHIMCVLCWVVSNQQRRNCLFFWHLSRDL